MQTNFVPASWSESSTPNRAYAALHVATRCSSVREQRAISLMFVLRSIREVQGTAHRTAPYTTEEIAPISQLAHQSRQLPLQEVCGTAIRAPCLHCVAASNRTALSTVVMMLLLNESGCIRAVAEQLDST